MDLRPKHEPTESSSTDDGLAPLAASRDIPDGSTVDIAVVVDSHAPHLRATERGADQRDA